MSTENSEDLELLPEERDTLERFLRLEIPSDELRTQLARVAKFTATESERKIEPLFRFLEPGIPVTRSDVENALNKKRLGQITESELAEWAAIVLLLSDAYEFDPARDDEVANWLNDLSWLPSQDRSK